MTSLQRLAKEKLVTEFGESLKEVEAAVVTQCSGISVDKITQFRAKLRQQDIKIRVMKNTLILRAVQGTPLEVLQDEFRGPTAIAYTQKDPIALARVLMEFARQEQKFVIRTGVLHGTRIDKSGIETLATMPSREVLLGRFLGALAYPYAGLVYALSGILRKSVYALDAIRRKKEGEGIL